MGGWLAGWLAGPTVMIRLSQFNLTKFKCQLELSLAIFVNIDCLVSQLWFELEAWLSCSTLLG